MKNAPNNTRRAFIERILAAGTGVSLGSGALAAARPSATELSTAAPSTLPSSILTPEESRLLTRMLNRIVPREDDMPGAGEIGVAAFIDDLLVYGPHLRGHFGQLLAHVRAQPRVDALPDSEFDEVLAGLERLYPSSFRLLLEATYLGYYSDPRIVVALGWTHPDMAGNPKVFDDRVLSHVRARGPLYRHV